MRKPLLSIVIANYNYGYFLEEAIQSVIAQDMGSKVELIICDAASTDNSVEIIKKYANGLPPNISYADWINSSNHNSQTPPLITWWCSEKDGGQSAAFNKGFSHARGRFLTWLNADDVMLPGTVNALRVASRAYPETAWFTGNVVQFDSDSRRILHAPWGPRRLPKCLQGQGYPLQIFGPTVFLRRDIFKLNGPIDETLQFTMDTEYWIRLTLSGFKQRRLSHACWGFRIHSGSKTAAFSKKVMSDEEMKRSMIAGLEKEYIIKKWHYRPRAIGRWLIFIYRLFDLSLLQSFFRQIRLSGVLLENVYVYR